jgi:hypothetical protein
MSSTFHVGWIVCFVLMGLMMWFCVSSFHGGGCRWCHGWDNRPSICEAFDEEEGNAPIPKSEFKYGLNKEEGSGPSNVEKGSMSL